MTRNEKAASERVVVEVLKDAPDLSVEEVAQVLGLARSTARKRLAAAIADGTVKRHAGGREGRRRLPDRYTVIEGPQEAAPPSRTRNGAPACARESSTGSSSPTSPGTPTRRRSARPRWRERWEGARAPSRTASSVWPGVAR